MAYSAEECRSFRRLQHVRRGDSGALWVFPSMGEWIITFDRRHYYNYFADQDLMTPEQLRIAQREGPFCMDYQNDPEA